MPEPSSRRRFECRRRNDGRSLKGTGQKRGLSGGPMLWQALRGKSCSRGLGSHAFGQGTDRDWFGQYLDPREGDRLARRKAALRDDMKLPRVRYFPWYLAPASPRPEL